MDKRKLVVGGREFGPFNPMYIAEISCNHAQDVEVGRKLISKAQLYGADAIKLQLYTPEQMTAPSFSDPYYNETWSRWLWDLYAEAQTGPTLWRELAEHARRRDLLVGTSVFTTDTEVLEMAASKSDFLKIASAEAPWTALRVAVGSLQGGLPVFISDGCVDRPDDTLFGLDDPVVMRCAAEYPASTESYGFADLHEFDYRWGLSDHTCQSLTWVTAALGGAVAIEAHLALREVRTLDARHSITPKEFWSFRRDTDAAIQMWSGGKKGAERGFVRRWVWAKDLLAGHVVSRDDVVALRAREGRLASEAPPWGVKLSRTVKQWEPVR